MNKKSQTIIGIDARFYGPKQKGLGRYVQKLIENLEKIDFKNQYIIFLRKENWNEYQPKNPSFRKVLADCRWYTLKEQILMPLKIRQAKVDLMHFPHFNLPVFYFGPFVVTIHDLVLKRFPTRRASTLGPLLYWLKNLIYQLIIFLAVKRAKKIITVSNYTKNDILKFFKVKSEKIEVIYEGSPAVGEFLQERGGLPHDDILQKLNINKPYLIYVGNAYPHKNLERMILAFGKLVKEDINHQLILVGGMDYFYQRLKKFVKDLENRFFEKGLSSQIIFTDFVSDDELRVLYQNASLYVFPSLCEGFGLPPLEAMAYGLPVVCSNTSCLPEILGPAATYFNPADPQEMAKTIRQVLEDKDLKEKLVLEGFKRAKGYCWSKMARETLAIYNHLAKERGFQ
jgi:glycosyltransferase involved in cell wall biosynthesis